MATGMLTKHGVTVRCEQCRFVASDQRGGFDVAVPIGASDCGVAGTARLHCIVAPEGHQVALVEWHDADRRPVEASDEVRQRLTAALGFVAEQRICGNRRVCPAEIVRIVEEHTRRR